MTKILTLLYCFSKTRAARVKLLSITKRQKMKHPLRLCLSAFLVLLNISFVYASVEEKETIPLIKNGFSFKSLQKYIEEEGTKSATVDVAHKSLKIEDKKKFGKSLAGLLKVYVQELVKKLSFPSLKRFLENNKKKTAGYTFSDFEWAGFKPFNITTQNAIKEAYKKKAEKKTLTQAIKHGFETMKQTFEEAINSSEQENGSSLTNPQKSEEEAQDSYQSNANHESEAEKEDFEERIKGQSAVIKKLKEEKKEYEERLVAQKETIVRERQRKKQSERINQIFFNFLGIKDIKEFQEIKDPSQRKKLLAKIPALDLNELIKQMASFYEEGEAVSE
jgi:hypothetical protein